MANLVGPSVMSMYSAPSLTASRAAYEDVVHLEFAALEYSGRKDLCTLSGFSFGLNEVSSYGVWFPPDNSRVAEVFTFWALHTQLRSFSQINHCCSRLETGRDVVLVTYHRNNMSITLPLGLTASALSVQSLNALNNALQEFVPTDKFSLYFKISNEPLARVATLMLKVGQLIEEGKGAMFVCPLDGDEIDDIDLRIYLLDLWLRVRRPSYQECVRYGVDLEMVMHLLEEILDSACQDPEWAEITQCPTYESFHTGCPSLYVDDQRHKSTLGSPVVEYHKEEWANGLICVKTQDSEDLLVADDPAAGFPVLCIPFARSENIAQASILRGDIIRLWDVSPIHVLKEWIERYEKMTGVKSPPFGVRCRHCGVFCQRGAPPRGLPDTSALEGVFCGLFGDSCYMVSSVVLPPFLSSVKDWDPPLDPSEASDCSKTRFLYYSCRTFESSGLPWENEEYYFKIRQNHHRNREMALLQSCGTNSTFSGPCISRLYLPTWGKGFRFWTASPGKAWFKLALVREPVQEDFPDLFRIGNTPVHSLFGIVLELALSSDENNNNA